MTGDFAAAIVGVAPVVLLVAVVEVNNARPRLRDAHEDMRRRIETFESLYGARHTLSPEEATDAATNRRTIGRSSLRDLFFTIYVLLSAVVACMLGMAEQLALQWLATPGEGPHESEATFCVSVVVFSFLWITAVPIFALSKAALRIIRLQKSARKMDRRITELLAAPRSETDPQARE